NDLNEWIVTFNGQQHLAAAGGANAGTQRRAACPRVRWSDLLCPETFSVAHLFELEYKTRSHVAHQKVDYATTKKAQHIKAVDFPMPA
ncbi:MAG: hypothetical protein HW412_642, partial [Bacteroidetes bacterium]|nr:hypothetical protein [Bacteroidota bacterium]